MGSTPIGVFFVIFCACRSEDRIPCLPLSASRHSCPASPTKGYSAVLQEVIRRIRSVELQEGTEQPGEVLDEPAGKRSLLPLFERQQATVSIVALLLDGEAGRDFAVVDHEHELSVEGERADIEIACADRGQGA